MVQQIPQGFREVKPLDTTDIPSGFREVKAIDPSIPQVQTPLQLS